MNENITGIDILIDIQGEPLRVWVSRIDKVRDRETDKWVLQLECEGEQSEDGGRI